MSGFPQKEEGGTIEAEEENENGEKGGKRTREGPLGQIIKVPSIQKVTSFFPCQ